MEQLQVSKQCQFILKPRPSDVLPMPAGEAPPKKKTKQNNFKNLKENKQKKLLYHPPKTFLRASSRPILTLKDPYMHIFHLLDVVLGI